MVAPPLQDLPSQIGCSTHGMKKTCPNRKSYHSSKRAVLACMPTPNRKSFKSNKRDFLECRPAQIADSLILVNDSFWNVELPEPQILSIRQTIFSRKHGARIFAPMVIVTSNVLVLSYMSATMWAISIGKSKHSDHSAPMGAQRKSFRSLNTSKTNPNVQQPT